MKKVIISGANSFIGRYLVPLFLEDGWQVTAVVRNERSAACLPHGVRVVALDLQEYDKIGALCGACDCFVHLAWNGTRGEQRMDSMLQNRNVQYSLKGIESVLKAGCRCVILAGSQAEFSPSADAISEESPCVPVSEYGKAKLQLYKECMDLCSKAGVSIKEVRIFSLYGPGDSAETMIMQMLENMLSARECLLTEGIQMWDFLYVKDAAEAIYQLCTHNCADGVYNLGSGDVRPLREYVQEMAELTSSASCLCFGAVPYPMTGMVSLWPDISKISRELRWEPKVSFSAGIRSILDTFLEKKQNEAV